MQADDPMCAMPDPAVIRWKMHLSSPPDRVYSALTTDDGRASFWAERALDVGGTIEFEFINGVRESSEILERDTDRRFALRYFGTETFFDLAPAEDGGTDLTLTTRGFRPEEREDLLAGWLNVLFPLKAAVDHGVDLRNHDPTRTWDEGWADQ